MQPLILASTSPFRRELLGRLGLPFEAVPPPYEEVPLVGVGPGGLALAHALGKARSLSTRFPDRIVIGSDQVAEVGGELLGKPGTPAAAVSQLRRLAGRTASFHTGLAVVQGAREETALETVRTTLRPLSREEIEAYVAADRPLHCAGSFRIEALGIALMEAVEGRDFTALIGLPLIALTSLLGRFGVSVLRGAGQGVKGTGRSA